MDNVNHSQPEYLPASSEDMRRLGWDAPDILLITGAAYVDHPSFGAALLGRWLPAHGFRVGVIAQPRWETDEDVRRLGRPRLFAGVTAGALDSMLAHYTAFRKRRTDDAYTPGGRAGARPNRACLVYTSLVRHAFPGIPVVLGGIEASMRRAAHYDFWSDSIRRSILLDSKADLVVCGMGERAILEIARRLASKPPGPAARDTAASRTLLSGIAGTAWIGSPPADAPAASIPFHEEIVEDPRRLMPATLALEEQAHHGVDWLVQPSGDRTVVFAPPAAPLTTAELDALYALPFRRRAHPAYTEPIPAVEMVQFSVTTHRGCAGGCTFCALAQHQGRRMASRSKGSILDEVRGFTRHPDWRGAITNVGGPSANMWGAVCLADPHRCRRPSCLWPEICRHFRAPQEQIAALLRDVAALPGVRHVRTASGVRHDLALREPAYLEALVGDFTGGQLTVAPEHNVERVLWLMRKPPFEAFERFLAEFQQVSRRAGKEQYLIPYLISAFPGCTEKDMRDLGAWLRQRDWRPQQVQCFIPTPGTVATAMFCGAIDTEGKPIPVARTDAERLRQHRILADGTAPGSSHVTAQVPARGGRAPERIDASQFHQHRG